MISNDVISNLDTHHFVETIIQMQNRFQLWPHFFRGQP